MTKTGKWLADWMAEDGAIDRLPEGWDDPHALVQRIEAEATAAAEQRLRERVEALPAQPYTLSGLDTTTDSRMVNRAAVLALLDTSSPASPRQGEPVEGLDDMDDLELAMGIIANVGGGDWTRETPEWQEAAARWRDRVMPGLAARSMPKA